MAAVLDHVFRRGILDDLDAGQSLGGHALEEGLQRRAVHTGGLAIEPHRHLLRAAHGDVALLVHLHGGRVADGVVGGESSHRLVVLDVVVHHFAGHAVDRLRCRDADFFQLHEFYLGVDAVKLGLADSVGLRLRQKRQQGEGKQQGLFHCFSNSVYVMCWAILRASSSPMTRKARTTMRSDGQ